MRSDWSFIKKIPGNSGLIFLVNVGSNKLSVALAVFKILLPDSD